MQVPKHATCKHSRIAKSRRSNAGDFSQTPAQESISEIAMYHQTATVIRDVPLPCEKQERLLCGFRPIVKLDLQIPFLEQPFRYIATIAIGLAPLLQFGRGRVFLLREAQAFDEEFKLGRTLGDVGCNVAPIGISASVAHKSSRDADAGE